MKISDQWMSRSRSLLLMVFICFLGGALKVMGPSNGWAADLNQPVAKINGAVLTIFDLERALDRIMPAANFHGGFSSEKRASYRPRAFEKMMEAELLYQYTGEAGIRADPEAVQAEMQRNIKRLGGPQRYKEALKQAGLTPDQLKQRVLKDQMIKSLMEQEIISKAAPDRSEVEAFYETNKKAFFRPEARRIRHILVSVKPGSTASQKAARKARASDVLARLKAGEDMATLAWNYSDSPYRVKGGDLGLVHSGRLEPELEQAATRLPLDQLSGLIETASGYHLIRVEEVQAPRQLSLEEVEAKIHKMLAQKKEMALRKALLERLKSKAQIERY